jgi:hypothetical protein
MRMAFPLIFVLTLGGGFLFPWWWPALAAYGAGFWLAKNGPGAFLAGFAGTGGAWLLLAAFMDWRNRQILSTRVAEVFHLPSPWLLLVLTALIGGLLGGLGALAGRALRGWVSLRRRQAAADLP